MTPAEWLVDHGGKYTRMFCLSCSFCGTRRQVALWKEQMDDRIDYIGGIRLALPYGTVSELLKIGGEEPEGPLPDHDICGII